MLLRFLINPFNVVFVLHRFGISISPCMLLSSLFLVILLTMRMSLLLRSMLLLLICPLFIPLKHSSHSFAIYRPYSAYNYRKGPKPFLSTIDSSSVIHLLPDLEAKEH